MYEYSDGIRDRAYLVTCPLCNGSDSVNCEVCFNERTRLIYLPVTKLRSVVVVWAKDPAKRATNFVDEQGMFSLEFSEEALRSLKSLTVPEDLNYDYIPSELGKEENTLTIEFNEC